MKIKYLTSLLVSLCFLNSCSGRVPLERNVAEIEHASRVISLSGRHVRASIRPGGIGDRLAGIRKAQPSIPVRVPVKPDSSMDKGVVSAIPLRDTPEVRKYINLYTGKRKRDVEEPLKRRAQHLPVIEKVLDYFKLPLELSNVAFVESKFNEKAVSPRGALGMWHFMKPTARELGLRCNFWNDEREDVLRSSIAAAKYLRDLNARFGDWLLALAAYNAGPGRIAAAIDRAGGERDFFKLAERKLLPKETVAHVSKVIALTILTRGSSSSDRGSLSRASTTLKKLPVKKLVGDLPLNDDNV